MGTPKQFLDYPGLQKYDELIKNYLELTIPSVTDTYSSSGTDAVSGKAVAAALKTLDGTVSGSAGASKTLTAFSQTDGKVSATFGNISITKSQVSDLGTIGTAAAKAYTTSVTSGSADLVTSGAVYTAIDNLPEPMVFKGSLGTGGTITALPVNGTATVGDTYKVITAGTYAGTAAKVGDTFICDSKTSSANTWALIPSGDEPSGTVTSVAVANGGGLSVSGSPITSSGTITISHADTSSQASVNNSGRTYIQDISLDTYGHVTKIASATETVVNTDRYVNSAAFADATSADANNPVKLTLTRAGSDTASVTAYIPKVSSSSAGVAPKGAAVSSQSQSTKFLREDGTWAAPSYTTNTNTHRPIQMNGTEILGNNTTALNLKAGTNVSLSNSSGTVTIAATDTNTWRGIQDNLTSSTNTTESLSAKQGYLLANGSARDNTKLPITNNAGYHNSIYRGKSLGTSITAEQWAAISSGTFDDLYIGDYWTLSTTFGETTSNVQYVIAGFDYWWNCGDSYPQSSNKHHVVLVPASNLYSAKMNDSNITTGGYVGSKMYTDYLANARTGISTLFGDHLYSVRRLFVNAVNAAGQGTGWAWYTSSVDLMNETMVYGHPVWTTSGFEVGVDRTILPLFALNPASASSRSVWWLRCAATSADFADVSYNGYASYTGASGSYGVRPAFAIY